MHNSVVTRTPRRALRPFVRQLWVGTTASPNAQIREHTLPSGDMHLVVRPAGEPVRVVASDDATATSVGAAVVGGVRTTFYIKEVSSGVRSVGVTFHPATAGALFGYTAEELSGRHHSLDDLWSASAAARLQEQLSAASDPETQLDILEETIAARLPRLRRPHPAVAAALEQFRVTTNVTRAVRASGYSHRTVAEQFRRTMGVSPKAYLQLARMRRLLARIGAVPWSDLAAEAGFSDQAHFVREFRKFTGATPTAYQRSRPLHPYHFRILQDGASSTR